MPPFVGVCSGRRPPPPDIHQRPSVSTRSYIGGHRRTSRVQPSAGISRPNTPTPPGHKSLRGRASKYLPMPVQHEWILRTVSSRIKTNGICGHPFDNCRPAGGQAPTRCLAWPDGLRELPRRVVVPGGGRSCREGRRSCREGRRSCREGRRSCRGEA